MRLSGLWALLAVAAACGGASSNRGAGGSGAGGSGAGGSSPYARGGAANDEPAGSGAAVGIGGGPTGESAGSPGELAGGEAGLLPIAMCEPDVVAGNGGAVGDNGGAGDDGSAGAPDSCSICFDGDCQPAPIGAGGVGQCACPSYAPDFCASSNVCTKLAEDAAHCGACATRCGVTEACDAGKCTPAPRLLARLPGCGVVRLLLQSGKLYALDQAAGELVRIALPGGSRVRIAQGLSAPSAFALDATTAYVVTGKSIARVSLSDGATSVAVKEAAGIYDVAVRDGKLYYGVGKPDDMPGGDVKSVAASAINGAGVPIAKVADLGVPKGVAVSGDYVFYATDEASEVQADLLVGVGHVKVAPSQGALMFGHRSVQTDGQNVLWMSVNVQRRAPSSTEQIDNTVAWSRTLATAFAFNATTVYVASDAGDLEKAAFGVQPSQRLARNLGRIDSIVLDDVNVYFSTVGGKIMTTPL